MATARDQAFMRRLARRLSAEAARIVRPRIPSRTLARALKQIPPENRQGFVSAGLLIPHYWAVYVHDGRGPSGPRRSKVLIFWRNRRQDPRLRGRGGQTPERLSQVQRLTEAQYRRALEQRNAARRAGRPSPVIFVRSTGRVAAQPFFDNDDAMRPFLGVARRIAEEEARTHILRTLSPLLGARSNLRAVAGVPVIFPPVERKLTIRVRGGLPRS